MSNQSFHIDKGGEVKPQKPLTPKAIEAQSQSRNSCIRIVILGVLLGLLSLALFIAILCRPEHVKDLLIVIGSIAAYMAGSGEFSRKEEK